MPTSTNDVSAFYAGSKPVQKLYAGSKQVWTDGPTFPVGEAEASVIIDSRAVVNVLNTTDILINSYHDIDYARPGGYRPDFFRTTGQAPASPDTYKSQSAPDYAFGVVYPSGGGTLSNTGIRNVRLGPASDLPLGAYSVMYRFGSAHGLDAGEFVRIYARMYYSFSCPGGGSTCVDMSTGANGSDFSVPVYTDAPEGGYWPVNWFPGGDYAGSPPPLD